MSALEDLLRDFASLEELEVEELAGYLLEHLNSLPAPEQDRLHLRNFCLAVAGKFFPEGRPEYEAAARILGEGWTWLEAHGLLTQHPGRDPGWFFISRRGKRLRTRADFLSFRRAGLLARERLHSEIARVAWPSFVRGEYETAVFASFKEVEVAVRRAGKFAATDIGVPLMRKAFSVPDGPLTDKSLIPAEQQSVSDLFAGSIGLFKNPSSHRHVAFSDPAEASELIGLASYLLRIVDSRTESDSGKPLDR